MRVSKKISALGVGTAPVLLAAFDVVKAFDGQELEAITRMVCVYIVSQTLLDIVMVWKGKK